MEKIIPGISIENCKEVLEYYKEVFGGEIKNVQVADDREMFAGHEGKIIHSELHIDRDCMLYLTDVFEPQAANGNISITLQMTNDEEISRIFYTLSKDGKVVFDLQKTFWGSHHAVVIDRYGTKWSLDYSAK